MELKDVIRLLIEAAAEYPNLTKLELIELMKLKTMMEANNINGRR